MSSSNKDTPVREGQEEKGLEGKEREKGGMKGCKQLCHNKHEWNVLPNFLIYRCASKWRKM